jgi:hypothetical protein
MYYLFVQIRTTVLSGEMNERKICIVIGAAWQREIQARNVPIGFRINPLRDSRSMRGLR